VAVIVGLDVGTTTIGGVALDLGRGELVSRASRANTAQSTPQPGREELDVDGALDLVQEVLAELVDGRASEVTAIGVTGQMHGVAFLDEHGRAVRSAITWRDRRVEEPHPAGGTYLDAFKRRAGPGSFERTGCEPAVGFLGPTLFLLQERGELPDALVCSIPDAIVSGLTGQRPWTDPTNGAGSGVFDVARGDWDAGLLERVGLPAKRFPRVAEAGVRVGPLRTELAQPLGLAASVSVGNALGDHQASVLASVRAPFDTIHVNIGTGGQVSTPVASFSRIAGIETRPWPGHRYLLTGAGLVGGRSLAWLVSRFQEIGAELFGAGRDEEELYDTLLRLGAAVPPGADGLRCSPLFAGTRADPTLRGSFTGIGQANVSVGHVTRALLEGMTDVLVDLYRQIEPSAGVRDQLVGSGNAVRRGPLLGSILADRFGRPLRQTVWPEESAAGAALACAVGTGALPDYDAAAELVRYR
jgi:sugar (pentulose or hexulose) kinase